LLIALVYKTEKRWPAVKRQDILPLVLLGLTGVLLYNVCFFRGLKDIPAATGSVCVPEPIAPDIEEVAAIVATD